jgi:hypothetical protein
MEYSGIIGYSRIIISPNTFLGSTNMENLALVASFAFIKTTNRL